MKTAGVPIILGLLLVHFINQALCAQEKIVSDSIVTRLELGASIERQIKPGEIHSFKIMLTTGQFLNAVVTQRGIDVMVTLFDVNGNKFNVIDGREGSEGSEPIEIEAASSGYYRVEIKALDRVTTPGIYEAKVLEIISPEEYAKRLEKEPEIVKDWIGKNAINLKTVEVGKGFEDLQPLKELIGNSHLVALGEATHGSREFFQLNHRMLEFLVEEMGFTVFGTESEMPEGYDINRYILTGKGDPIKALAGLDAPLKNTEEVLGMIEWMRKYNEDINHTKKIKWYGIDIQKTLRPVHNVIKYLDKIEPEQASYMRAGLDLLANPYRERDFRSLSAEQIKQMSDLIDNLLAHFDNQRDNYIENSSEEEWSIARYNVKLIDNVIKIRTSSPYKPVRDSIMAENVRWILDMEGPDTKMMIWAHYGHVTNVFLSAGSMGWHLRKMFGDDLVTFGFAFNQGSFQAFEMPPSTAGIHSFTVAPSKEGTFDATLAAAGLNIAVINFHDLPKKGPVADWFNRTHGQRIIGGSYSERYAKEFLESGYPQIFPHQYDAIFFVENTAATRLLNTEGYNPAKILDGPKNLDFEDGEVGNPPPNWLLPSELSSFNFEAVLPEELAAINFQYITDTNHPYTGKQCMSINKVHAQIYGETYGWIRQVTDATQYKNKKIKLSAAVRIEPNETNDKAYLWLKVSKPGYGSQGRVFFDKMADRPITSSEWNKYEIIGEVTEDAILIEYGFAFVGDGKAYIDGVSLNTVEK